MLWDRVGLGVVEWVGARGGTRPSWHKPISIIINHKFTIPSSISTLGTSRSAKMDSQFLHNPISIPLKGMISSGREGSLRFNYFGSWHEINC